MAQVIGIIEGVQYYWSRDMWCAESDNAEEMTLPEAFRRLRIINANNRFLDREDRIEARVVESR